MSILRRAVVTAVATSAALALSAGPSLAHECVNASKQPGAGAQIVIGPNDVVEWISTGLQARVAQGLVDLNGGGFHGLIGIDFDGDGAADVTTWIVGKDGEVPENAQYNGPVCKGVTNIDLWFEECAPAG